MSEHIGLNKLKGFEPIYVINLESRKDRFDYMSNQFTENNIKNYTFVHGYDGKTFDLEKIVFNKTSIQLTNNEMAASISHLKAIDFWLKNSNSDYAIIMEDDLSFETVKKWNFNFNDFIKSIKSPYDMIQMCIIHNYKINTTLHMRETGDWSGACYLIKRTRAEQLLKKYFIDDKYVLPQSHYEACPESVVFLGCKVLSVPLFTYNMELESSIEADYHAPFTKEQVLLKSKIQTLDYWSNNNMVKQL